MLDAAAALFYCAMSAAITPFLPMFDFYAGFFVD